MNKIGIYFLWLKGECVYVGQSRNIDERVAHHEGRIAFDRWTCMECSEFELNGFESRFIGALKPAANFHTPNRDLPPQIPGRFLSLQELRQRFLPLHLNPVPSMDTLRNWFDEARIPRQKSNPTAKRGGGTVFYSVAAIEKWLKARTTFA